MTYVFVDPKKCALCPVCHALRVCTAKAITHLEPDSPPFVETRFCTACGDCVDACSFDAIALR
ncbi:MAG: 4Fe-4S binding protein [Thaumarchaeota archaeon]|nr:4Fe-4S binding protein [Nitrososphaerota archaeon]